MGGWDDSRKDEAFGVKLKASGVNDNDFCDCDFIADPIIRGFVSILLCSRVGASISAGVCVLVFSSIVE